MANITFSKLSGSGNSGKIDITSQDVYTGRESIVQDYRVKTSQGASATIRVTRAGHPIFITPNLSSYNISNDGGSISIMGKSNIGEDLILEVSGQDEDISTPDNTTSSIVLRNFVINGNLQVFNKEGDNIRVTLTSSDYGKESQYTWQADFTIHGNTSIVARTWKLKIGNSSAMTDEIIITQSAGNAYIYVNTNGVDENSNCNIQLDKDNLNSSVYVLSNISWVINQD